MKSKTYLELITLPTFEKRFEYLKLDGSVGKETFGYDRYLNQTFYNSAAWKDFRNRIILRDNGCDLACDGHELNSKVVVHHINPINIDDVINNPSVLLDPNNAICTCHKTHNAIHYGDKNLIDVDPIERTENDTCPWKK